MPSFQIYARGYSDVPKETVSIEMSVQQLLEIIDFSFGPTSQVTLVGLSQGGAISATFASQHSNRIRKLILLAPAGAGADVPVAL